MTDNRPQPVDGAPDVAAILEQLRAAVRAQHEARRQIGDDTLHRALQRSLDDLEITRVVSAHWPLIGRTLPQKVMALINKIVRRYLRWYINPIVEQQNAFNDAAARTLRLLAEAYQELAHQVAEQQETETQTRNKGNETQGDNGANERAPEEHSAAEIDPASAPNHADLMAQVRERAASEPPARFIELELLDALNHAQSRQTVTAHWTLTGRTVAEKVIALHNRVVRQYLRWLINPIVEQQNAANEALTAALRALIRVDAASRAEIAAFRASRPAVRR
ncbi:hypothetical protein [Roseiflexus castenholzii]|jgi:short subunit dehydrogenase-like uncharacterized protein|uniref:Uncharacterized protein n=1 Tax=Roseiflexus castenholzii (strain DSM 13941 / HLO8) TaxID=383372 RepID=A7NF42_ROSCS|nr:hypothetical protein [Roseiflexus castenholzii]ABU58765.1 conserved hypothetical protein [Roseiflexus castenholzii DSM 13941]